MNGPFVLKMQSPAFFFLQVYWISLQPLAYICQCLQPKRQEYERDPKSHAWHSPVANSKKHNHRQTSTHMQTQTNCRILNACHFAA